MTNVSVELVPALSFGFLPPLYTICMFNTNINKNIYLVCSDACVYVFILIIERRILLSIGFTVEGQSSL